MNVNYCIFGGAKGDTRINAVIIWDARVALCLLEKGKSLIKVEEENFPTEKRLSRGTSTKKN